MRRAHLMAALAALSFTFGGCGLFGGTSPEQVYYGMVTCAEMGDRDGFLKGFTDKSKRLIEANISISEAYGLKRNDPLKQLVFKKVDAVEIDEDKAYLSVSSGRRKTRILMVETEDGWRIDTAKLAKFWENEKKKSR